MKHPQQQTQSFDMSSSFGFKGWGWGLPCQTTRWLHWFHQGSQTAPHLCVSSCQFIERGLKMKIWDGVLQQNFLQLVRLAKTNGTGRQIQSTNWSGHHHLPSIWQHFKFHSSIPSTNIIMKCSHFCHGHGHGHGHGHIFVMVNSYFGLPNTTFLMQYITWHYLMWRNKKIFLN